MKRWLSICMVILLAGTMALPASAAEAQADEPQQYEGEYAQGSAIVKVTGEFTSSQARARSSVPYEVETLLEVPDISESEEGMTAYSTSDVGGERFLLAKSDSLSTEKLIQVLEESTGVEYAEPDYIIEACSINEADEESSYTDDPALSRQWHLEKQENVAGASNVPYIWEGDAQEAGVTGGDDVVVAVIDSGVDYNHPDLMDNMWMDPDTGTCGRDFSGDAENGEDNDPMDAHGHGTHVAGIIGASGNNGTGVSGVNQKIQIAALRVLNAENKGTVSGGIQAYAYMIAQKAKGENFVAANNSWGCCEISRSMQEVVDAAGKTGIVSVFASDNESADRDTTANTPDSGYREASITVNASDLEGNAADFSNFGQVNTDLYAPGVDVFSTVLERDAVCYPDGAMVGEADGYILWRDELQNDPDISGEDPAVKKVMDVSGDVTEDAVQIIWDAQSECVKWMIHPDEEGDRLGIECELGDLSEYKDTARYLSFMSGLTDETNTGAYRYLSVDVRDTEGNWMQITRAATAYGTPATYFTSLEEMKDDIDWENFAIRIIRTAVSVDVGQTLTFTLDDFALGMDVYPYGLMSGTSMATPVVTGAVALLSTKYQVTEAAEDEQAELMKEIRARVVGGVTRTEEMKNKCVSGGYLNLERAVTNPYPVLDQCVQNGALAEITGYFFGTQGTIDMDGVELAVIEWTENKISFTLPEGTVEGAHTFQVTNTEDADWGDSQCGQDQFRIEAVEDENQETQAALFEELPVPELEKLGISTLPDEEFNYSVDAYKGKIYVTSGNLFAENSTTDCGVILVYDEEKQSWDAVTLPFIQAGGELQLVVGDHMLYLFSNLFDKKLVIYQYNLDTKQVSDLTEVELAYIEYKSSLVWDGASIWRIGGLYEDENTGEMAVCDDVMKIDGSTGVCTTMPSLNKARVNVQAEMVKGKIVVTGGENEVGEWENTTEIWDGKSWSSKTTYPTVYDNQSNAAASGSFDGKMIVSGMFSDETHTNDTYVYDMDTDIWSPVAQNLSDAKVYCPGGVVSGNYLYVYGTTSFKNNVADIFCRLKVKADAGEEEVVPGDTTTSGEEIGSEDTAISGIKVSDVGKSAENKVKTGDANNMIPLIVILISSLAVIVAVVIIARRRNRKG